jgi:hypothetical protein
MRLEQNPQSSTQDEKPPLSNTSGLLIQYGVFFLIITTNPSVFQSTALH